MVWLLILLSAVLLACISELMLEDLYLHVLDEQESLHLIKGISRAKRVLEMSHFRVERRIKHAWLLSDSDNEQNLEMRLGLSFGWSFISLIVPLSFVDKIIFHVYFVMKKCFTDLWCRNYLTVQSILPPFIIIFWNLSVHFHARLRCVKKIFFSII